MIGRVSIVVLGFLLMASALSHAQNAYDSACYYPNVNDPDDFEAIWGTTANQHMGAILMSLPPIRGETYGRLLMSNAPASGKFISSYETGPQFSLLNLKRVDSSDSSPLQWAQGLGDWGYSYAHLRSPKYLDLVFYHGANGGHPLIFWADDNGEYDSSRSTQLLQNREDSLVWGTYRMPPYIANLTSDTVDDIVLCLQFTDVLPTRSNVFMALIKGGQQLYDQGRIAKFDDTAFWRTAGYADTLSHDTTNRNYALTADFRGVGRADFVASDDWGNLYYYRNDAPFDIHRFASAMLSDTLLSMREYSRYHAPKSGYLEVPRGFGAFAAFPKASGDRSCDLLLTPDPTGDSNYETGICIWRGGPHFGEKRIGYDSCDFLIHHPGFYNGSFRRIMGWPSLRCVGDITGTGNNVIITGGGNGLGSNFLAMYVLGHALDDKIDMFMPLYHGAGPFDTIVASNKGYKSFMRATPYAESDAQYNAGIYETGGVQLLKHGERIPVRLNPSFAVRSASISNSDIQVYPNPASQFVNVNFTSTIDGQATITLFDMLGRRVLHAEQRVLQGIQTLHLDLPPTLGHGSYVLKISAKNLTLRTMISIL